MEKFARLGIVVENGVAVRNIHVTTDQLKMLANGGRDATAVLKGLSGGMTQAGAQAEQTARSFKAMHSAGMTWTSFLRANMAPAMAQFGGHTGAMRELGAQWRSLSSAAGAASRPTGRLTDSILGVTAAANGNRLTLGRLGNQFTSLTAQIAGVHPVVGNLTSVLGNFAVGSLLMTGILGGTAILAALYATITNGARKAREEQDRLVTSLNREISLKALGPGGETVDQVKAAEARAATLKGQIDKMERELRGPDSGFGRKELLQGKLTDLYTERQGALNTAAGGRSIVRERENDALEAARREELERQRAANTLKEKAEREAMARDKFAAEERSRAFELAGRQEGYKREARQLSLVPERAAVSVTQQLTEAQEKLLDVVLSVSRAFENAEQRLATGREAWKPGNIGTGIKTGVTNGIAGALEQYSPANLAGGLVTSLIGTAISGFTSMFQSGKAAAEEFRKASVTLKSAIDSYHAEATGNSLESDLLTADARYQDQVDRINSRYPDLSRLPGLGGRDPHRAAREAAGAEADADRARTEERIRREHRYDEQYAKEDLDVRNLRSTGRGDEADRLTFKNRNDREYAAEYDKAMADGFISAAEWNRLTYLATVQGNELIAYTNGLLSDAIRNGPSGFRIDPYTYQFQTPRGASDPYGTGMLPPNYPIDPTPPYLTPPGGGTVGRPPTPQTPGTVELVFQPGAFVMDKDGVVRIVVEKIDQKAAQAGGGGSSRAAALELL